MRNEKTKQLSRRQARLAKKHGFVPKPDYEDYILFCLKAGKEVM